MGRGRSRGTAPPRNSLLFCSMTQLHRPSTPGSSVRIPVNVTTPDLSLRSTAAPLRRVDARSGDCGYGRLWGVRHMRTPTCRCRLRHGHASDHGIAEVLMMPGESGASVASISDRATEGRLPRRRIPDRIVFDHVIAALAGC
jgi:hypothetical protein